MAGLKPQGHSSGGSVDLEREYDKDKFKTLEELEKERETLIDNNMTIEVGLSNKNVTDVRGKRISDEEYQQQRHLFIQEKLRNNQRITKVNKLMKTIKKNLLLKLMKESKEEKTKTRELIIKNVLEKENPFIYLEQRIGAIINEIYELRDIIRELKEDHSQKNSGK